MDKNTSTIQEVTTGLTNKTARRLSEAEIQEIQRSVKNTIRRHDYKDVTADTNIPSRLWFISHMSSHADIFSKNIYNLILSGRRDIAADLKNQYFTGAVKSTFYSLVFGLVALWSFKKRYIRLFNMPLTKHIYKATLLSASTLTLLEVFSKTRPMWNRFSVANRLLKQ